MSVARSRAREKRADRLNCLAVSTNDASDIRLPHSKPEHRGIAVRAFGDDDLVGKLDQVANDELEELFHAVSVAGDDRLSPLPLRHFTRLSTLRLRPEAARGGSPLQKSERGRRFG